MEPLQSLNSGNRGVHPAIKPDPGDAKIQKDQGNQSQQNVQDQVNVQGVDNQAAAINDIRSVAELIAEQNQLAMQSASQLSGLDLLGTNMNVSNQGGMIDSIMEGL